MGLTGIRARLPPPGSLNPTLLVAQNITPTTPHPSNASTSMADGISANNQQKSHGAWIGIDLGTSNCTAAIWDCNSSSCKVLRLGHRSLARPSNSSGSEKGGKIVPSAVLFYEGGVAAGVAAGVDSGSGVRDVVDGTSVNTVKFGSGGTATILGMSTLVGYEAVQCTSDSVKSVTINNEVDQQSTALVTSVKRVVGMTSRQAAGLQRADPDFWNSLPFQSIVLNDEKADAVVEQQKSTHKSDLVEAYDVLGDTNNQTAPLSKEQSEAKEGVSIRIRPLRYNPLAAGTQHSPTSPTSTTERLVSPLQVTTILLHSIRIAADEYLSKNSSKVRAPQSLQTKDEGESDHLDITIQNCVIGVPAHYSHAQRSAIQRAAKTAGFGGYVGVLTESSAAAMSYGLFVSPNAAARDGMEGKTILVFDMGGGTTDVTIATMDAPPEESSFNDQVRFQVVATAGDRCLGGDNVDEWLARFLWKKSNSSSSANTEEWKASEHQDFIRLCRRAKEQLCGNDDVVDEDDFENEGTQGMDEAQFTYQGHIIDITRQEFDSAIQPLVDRAEKVVDDALTQLGNSHDTTDIHEVVLVGGSSHIPTVRSMLRRKFPPPTPPDLCTSISAQTAVAQGLAIQAALVSGVVPLWELRNAMMLDALPHSIGVWVGVSNAGGNGEANGAPYSKGDIIHMQNDSADGHYVQILQKDNPLPAKGSATFTLANTTQPGVTIVAVEHIAEDTFQCMGVFNFLLHRLLDESLSTGVRQVEVGMVLETSGKFVVSIFDEKDPEHRERRRRYRQQKAIDEGRDADDVQKYYDEEESNGVFSGTEIGLLILCAVMFALYVGARIAFNDIEFKADSDEL